MSPLAQPESSAVAQVHTSVSKQCRIVSHPENLRTSIAILRASAGQKRKLDINIEYIFMEYLLSILRVGGKQLFYIDIYDSHSIARSDPHFLGVAMLALLAAGG